MTRFTSLVGIRYTLLNGSTGWKIFWICTVLLGTGCSVYHLFKLFLVFREQTIRTNINNVQSRTQIFPHVTICNLNHLRRSLVAQNSIYAVIGGLKGKKVKDYVKDGHDVFKTLETMGEKEILNQMEPELKTRQSHQLDTMLISCMFNNQPCNARNFTKYYEYDFGNCYIFHADTDKNIIRNPGPQNGLRLELFVELSEYIGKFSATSGFKVLVHDTNSMPFPVEDGFIVSPGTHTQIAFKKTIIHNVRYPFGHCQDVDTHQYFTEQCTKSCLQEYLLSHCNCYNPRYSFDIEINARTKHLGHCASTQSEGECADKIIKQYESGRICVEECPLRCVEAQFDFQSSLGSWPVDGQIGPSIQRFQDVLRNAGVFIPTDVYTGGHSRQKEFIRNNFVKLDVFYNQLNYILIGNDPSYSWFTFLADVGGQASLWLGFSFLSIFKIIEFIITLFQYKPEDENNTQSSCKFNNTKEFLV